jgi:hypothetical protein
MPNLFDALNTDLSSQQAGEAYHSQVDPLVEATTEVNKAKVVDTAQQTALDLAKQNAQKRVTLENQIDGIKKSISNLQNQLVEIDQEINNFNKPMSDEEIMRIGEQLNVPEVATNYINARSGRLNREFETKKYDVAKDESKKTRKEDYESTMRSLTTEINKLNDLKRKSAESDKSGIDVEIAGKQKELNVLNDKYSDEFGSSFLDSIKVDTKSSGDTNPGGDTTTEVDTESSKSIVPEGEGWGWNVEESDLSDKGKEKLQSDFDWANKIIDHVNKSKSWDSSKNSVIASIKGNRTPMSMQAVDDALYKADQAAESYQESQSDKKIQDAKDKDSFKKLYDRRIAVLNDEDSNPENKDSAKKWLKEHSNEITKYGLN